MPVCMHKYIDKIVNVNVDGNWGFQIVSYVIGRSKKN